MFKRIGLLVLLVVLQCLWHPTVTSAEFKFSTPVEISLAYWRKADSPQKFDAYLYGMEAAAWEINQAGGLAGHEVKITPHNDQGKVEETQRIAETIAKSDNVVSVVGFSNSKRATTAIESVSLAGIPILSSSGSSRVFDADPGKVFYTTNFGVRGEARYVEAFAKERGYRDALFVYKEGDGYSEEFFDEISKILPAAHVVYQENADDSFVESIRKQVKPETVIFISLTVNENGRLSQKVRAAGIASDIYLGRGGMVGVEFYDSGGRGIKNVFELSTLLAGLSNETLEDFAGKHPKFFKDEESLSYLEYAAYAYDMVHLINQSVKAVGVEVEGDIHELRKHIGKGLKSVTFEGITDTYSFSMDRVTDTYTSQYLLESNGYRALPYKKQFVFRNGKLHEIPIAFVNIDIMNVDVKNQEASVYDVEFVMTLTSIIDATLDDLDFENVVIGSSNYLPSIYSKEFFSEFDSLLEDDLKSRSYKVYGSFKWDNSIENFPFDTQEFGLLLKPKDPEKKDFLVYFTNKDQGRIVNRVQISGWDPLYFKSGYKKGSYYFSSIGGKDYATTYYRSSMVINAKRVSLSPAFKFIFPLLIVLFATVSLFFVPQSVDSADKVGAISNMLITVIALYFTYATIVDVNYITTVDIMYFGALALIITSKIALIMEYHSSSANYQKGYHGYLKIFTTRYKVLWLAEIFVFIAMIYYAAMKIFN